MRQKIKLNKKILLLLSLIILSIIGYINRPALSKPILRVKSINQWPGFELEHLMLYDVLSEKYQVVTVKFGDGYDMVLDGFFGRKIIKNKKAIKLYYTGEAAIPIIDNYDLVMGFDYLEKPNYIRIPLTYMVKQFNSESINPHFTRGECNPNKEYFACFLNSNGHQKLDGVRARDQIFYQLSLYKRVESGGRHLNNMERQVAKDKTKEFLSKCKFIIAGENQSYPGYISEKVYQAYFSGAVPIYYSDKDAVKDINKKAIIFAPDFKSSEDMLEYIKKLDNDNKLYCDIWNEKLVNDPNKSYEAIKDKLRKKLEPILAKLKK